MRHYMAAGMAAGRSLGGRRASLHFRRINTFFYRSFDHVEIEPEDEAIRHFGESWDNEWLPEIMRNHRKSAEFDFAGATVQGLLKHLEWSLNTVTRHYEIHGQLLGPGQIASELLESLYLDLYEDAGRLDVFKLTQGFENSSTIMGWDLYDLSQRAAEFPDVLAILDRTPLADVTEKLGQLEPGVLFAGELKKFLDLWGNRAESTSEINAPTWIEDPSPVIQNIKAYIASDGEHPRERWNELVAERKARVSEVRNLLATYPEPVKRKFEELLKAAQKYNLILEDHNWWIDQMTPANLRHVFMEFGRRLTAAGSIPRPEDVFMLDGDEIIEAAKHDFSVDLSSVVQERIAETEYWSDFDPPLKLGREDATAQQANSPRSPGEIIGATSPDGLEQQEGVITGSPASSGKITGTARVITKLADAGNLSRGKILVTVSTLSPWTPLFATAGAVVTDAGGALSHAAIVAREYGIPAVL
jgi:phosphohistidine swiveling domain-containing protein